ncbi:MAG: NAD(P)H-binding protein, partial [Ferruginibacter sp.]
MNILITGANGYIGQRLIPVLLEEDHHLYCCVRQKKRFDAAYTHEKITAIEIDFLEEDPECFLPENIDVAYYLIHSMSSGDDFEKKEAFTAQRFLQLLHKTKCQQIIYLTGIVNEANLSKHLGSRFAVEKILQASHIPLTALRAGIIVGSGSASFEIIRGVIE